MYPTDQVVSAGNGQLNGVSSQINGQINQVPQMSAMTSTLIQNPHNNSQTQLPASQLPNSALLQPPIQPAVSSPRLPFTSLKSPSSSLSPSLHSMSGITSVAPSSLLSSPSGISLFQLPAGGGTVNHQRSSNNIPINAYHVEYFGHNRQVFYHTNILPIIALQTTFYFPNL